MEVKALASGCVGRKQGFSRGMEGLRGQGRSFFSCLFLLSSSSFLFFVFAALRKSMSSRFCGFTQKRHILRGAVKRRQRRISERNPTMKFELIYCST
jgi:hypothetical protein